MERVVTFATDQERPMRVYFSHPIPETEGLQPNDLNDIARALLNLRSKASGLADQGVLQTKFTSADSPKAADIHLFPFNWNWYLQNSRADLVAKGVSEGKTNGKPVVLFSSGDYTANVPFSDLTIFQPCAYRSRRNENGNRVYAMPSFIPDFFELYCYGNVPLRKKGERPFVGFCGLAGGTWYHLLYRLFRLNVAAIAFRLGWRGGNPRRLSQQSFVRMFFLILKTMGARNAILYCGKGTALAIARRRRTHFTPRAWST